MAEKRRMTPVEVVDKVMGSEHADVVRESVAWLVAEKKIKSDLPVRDYKLSPKFGDLTFLRAATSLTAHVSPAAPRSCTASIASAATSSSVASRRSFSRNGLPTWTDGRFSSDPVPSSNDAKSDAPAIPSRPVSLPTR